MPLFFPSPEIQLVKTTAVTKKKKKKRNARCERSSLGGGVRCEETSAQLWVMFALGVGWVLVTWGCHHLPFILAWESLVKGLAL